MIKVYLDNCMFNRPFDDQSALRVYLETQAKLYIQQQIRNRKIALVWSYMLDFENDLNPYAERRFAIAQWKAIATHDIGGDDTILPIAEQLIALGIREKDALHVACAITAKADYFLTTDDKLLKKLHNHPQIIALNPIKFIQEIYHEN